MTGTVSVHTYTRRAHPLTHEWYDEPDPNTGTCRTCGDEDVDRTDDNLCQRCLDREVADARANEHWIAEPTGESSQPAEYDLDSLPF